MTISPNEVKKLSEGQSVELKKSLSQTKEALKTLCGMINSDVAMGEVWFGVSTDLSIAGIQGNLDSAQRTLTQHVGQKFDPPIICTIEILECESIPLLKLKADRATGVAYHEYDGHAYIREGSTTRQLSYSEKQSLFRKRNRDSHSGPWKCDRCGSFVVTLSSLVMTDQCPRRTFHCPCGGEYWPAD